MLGGVWPSDHRPEAVASSRTGSWKADVAALVILVTLASALWVPRMRGPIDLRWDAGVHFILGTSLARGTGYRLLNEPGEILAIQYPPLLPSIIAVHQKLLGSDDPTTVGRWLRGFFFVVFVAYTTLVFAFLRRFLATTYAFAATVLTLFNLHVYLLSDLAFPELLFSATTVLFLWCAGRPGGRYSALSYLFATLSYLLRTVGIAAFAAWVLESVLARRFRQAAIRLLLAAIPIGSWHAYIAAVEQSDAYQRPAYVYQRAAYNFYNVSYARNVTLRDPFAPEKGLLTPMRTLRRVAGNVLYTPGSLGEAVGMSRGYWRMWLEPPPGQRLRQVLALTGIHVLLYATGFAVLIGVVVLWFRGERRISLYATLYLAAMCLTPFRAQFLRYLMPVLPVLALALLVCLSAAARSARQRPASRLARSSVRVVGALLTVGLLTQIGTAVVVYTQQLGRVSYVDRADRHVEYRLFYYNDASEQFDRTIDYLRQHARRDQVVAAGTPHWIYLRTGLRSVMSPFESDVATAQALLDSVPVTYLIVGADVVGSERYMTPVVQRFSDKWTPVYTTPHWTLYRRK